MTADSLIFFTNSCSVARVRLGKLFSTSSKHVQRNIEIGPTNDIVGPSIDQVISKCLKLRENTFLSLFWGVEAEFLVKIVLSALLSEL
jgi:hypothetical protein